MVIDVVSVQYTGGFSPDVILLTVCYYHISSGNPNKSHLEFLSLQSTMFLRKRFDLIAIATLDLPPWAIGRGIVTCDLVHDPFLTFWDCGLSSDYNTT